MTRLDPNEKDRRGPKTTVQMGPPLDEAGAVPNEEPQDQDSITTAASYGSRLRRRRSATTSLKGKGKPLGGAPPIPTEQTHALAATMAPQPDFGTRSEEKEQDSQEYRVPKEPPSSLGGVGAAYNVNQKMARGEIDHPISLKEAKNMSKDDPKPAPTELSQESIEELEAAKAQLESEEEDSTGAELEEAEEEMFQRDTPFDYEGIQQQQQQLMSKERKNDIESRLSELDIADMIVKREIVQDISVVPGKLIYTMRTFNQHEHLFCLQYVYENPGSVTYAEEFLNTCKLVCALVAINGAHLPSHIDKNGDLDKKLFQKKMDHVASFPVHMIADLSVQAIWFNQRVNELFSVRNLKNG